MLTERLVRAATLARIADRWPENPDTLVVEEMGIHFGAARVDVAVVNGALHGFEIKSDADRLGRLPGQALAYSQVFDYMTVVVTTRLLSGAVEIVPDWWGVIEATENERTEAAILKERRRGRRNPSASPTAVAGLLWREELLAALESVGASVGVRTADRVTLQHRLAEVLSSEELGSAVRSTIRARRGWRESPAHGPNGEPCSPRHTSSRFLDRRFQSRLRSSTHRPG